jgi:long-subunit fatty acid transport protein
MKTKLLFAICMALSGYGPAAWALTDAESNIALPFSLSSPGARSMGMGGAFLGLADDATAAFTNPAGITQLQEPEISIEGRRVDYSVPFLAGGSASIDAFDSANLKAINAENSINNLSFLSFVYPIDRWRLAVYRHELLHYDNTFLSNLQPTLLDFGAPGVLDVFPTANQQSLKIVDYGLSAAVRINDAVSLGVGLSYYRFKIETVDARFSDVTFFTNPSVPLNAQVQTGSDNDIGLNLGAHFALTEQWSLGLAYRQGPKFDYRASAALFATVTLDGGLFTATPLSSPILVADLTKVGFKVPDVYATGLSWHPNDAWRVNFDFDEVMYSQLTEHLQSLFGVPAGSAAFRIKNAAELHLGAEYTFTQMDHPVSLRAGVWHDPRHSIEANGALAQAAALFATNGDTNSAIALAADALTFGVSRGAQTHGSVGAGMAFKQFQIDVGADFSDAADTYSISAVWRF